MINLDLEKHVNQQIEQSIKTYLDSEELKTRLKDQVNAALGHIIEHVAGKVYMEVMNENSFTEHINDIVKVEAAQQIQIITQAVVRENLATADISKIIDDKIQRTVTTNLVNVKLPENSIHPNAIDWSKQPLNGSYVRGGMIREFSSTGIDDKAKNVQLTILDDHVVTEGEFTAMNITAAENITAKNLSLTGTLEIGTEIIDHGPFSQMIQMHAGMVVDEALEPYKQLLINGQSIVNNGVLAPSVTQSNLRKIGNLSDLNVLGDAKFSETMFVSEHSKVGINTEEPRGALTVCDEDAEFSLTRTKRRTMFVGSTRDTDIEIGSHNQTQITLKQDIVDIANAVRVMGIKFSVSPGIPEYIGEMNEIVLISSARDDQAKFYICRGGNKWQALG